MTRCIHCFGYGNGFLALSEKRGYFLAYLPELFGWKA